MPTRKNVAPIAPRSAGFSLVEIAIVLVVAGLLTAIGLAALNNFLITSRLRATSVNAETVKTAISAFVARNNRLPCPAVPTLAAGAPGQGLEDSATAPGCVATTVGATSMAHGVVPWVSLGIPVDVATDGWYRLYTYNVTIAATQTTQATVQSMRGTMTLHTATPTALGLPASGNQINSCMNTATPPPGGDDGNGCNMRAVVMLISHGENGLGGYTATGARTPVAVTATEAENTDANIAFVSAYYSKIASDPFDDVVLALAPKDVLTDLERSGSLRSARAVTMENIRLAQDAVIASAFNTAANESVLVPAAAPLVLVDGWNRPLQYAQNLPNVCLQPAAAAAFTFLSSGVDGVAGINPATNLNDDITIVMPSAELRALAIKRGLTCTAT